MNIFKKYAKFIILILLILIVNYKKEKKIEKEHLNIYNLRINHIKNPFGIDIRENSYSFLSKGKGPFKAYILLDNKIVDSKNVKLNQSHSFHFRKPLEYNKVYKYVIKSHNNRNELKFETALKLKSPFIKPKNKKLNSPIFIKTFNLNKKIKKARLYITGLGLYQAFINNNKVGNAYLTPGFNDYDYYLRYQTYNITNLLKKENIIEIHMGNGWYKGRFGIHNHNNQTNIFGDEYKLCLHIYIEYENGKIVNILSDESWKVKSSKEVFNNIYDGEEIDYTLPENPLEEVIISKENYTLIPDFGALIVEKEILHPELYISPIGEKILDFKQNMVGFIRYKGLLNKNQEIKISHGEVLQNNSFFNSNLRTAKQLLKYKGDGEKRIYEPKFTYFGFRYALIEGIEKVDPNDFEGVVIYTNLQKRIKCETDNEKINKLIQNALWSQKGNFLDVPTDCPQRDERLGWTGDSQIFSNTACYNMDSYIFYKKYMNDLRGDQILYYKGDIPSISPSLKHQLNNGGAGWADAGTIIPWNIYLNYGDKKLLSKFYPMMKDYVNTLINKDINQGNYNLILTGNTFGDWLALDGNNNKTNFGGTDHKFINSVYYYHSVNLIFLAAKELEKKNDYEKYNILKNKIYNAILDKFFYDNGKLKLNTQTSYVLCLHYKIYKNKDIIIKDFKERIQNDTYHIKTGFIGSPLILLSLFDNNMEDYAYRLLFNEDYPSWIYPINLGATTIWERWNSLLENGKINNRRMNSLNHYAYGSVCESIYSRIAGLRNLVPGWKKVLIKPQINYRMKKMDFFYNSISGKYEIKWMWDYDKFYMNISIPNGCRATIILPDGKKYNVRKGKHRYECQLTNDIYSPFSIDTPIIDILKNEEASKLINSLIPKIYYSAIEKNSDLKAYNIRTANTLPMFKYSKNIIKKCDKELSKIRP